jgi:hypothetical protein
MGLVSTYYNITHLADSGLRKDKYILYSIIVLYFLA